MPRSRWLVVLMTVVASACGSPPPPSKPAPVAVVAPPVVSAVAAERLRREALATAHRKIEDEQSDALALTCTLPKADRGKQPRCLPSCYVPAAPDPRAGKQVTHAAEITHLVCEGPSAGTYLTLDGLAGTTLAVRPRRGRVPKAHKPGTWQASVEAAAALEWKPFLGKGDAVRVTGKWKTVVDPATNETRRCVLVSQFNKALKKPLDGCGAQGSLACEASGDAAAHGIDVVHYRLAEARRFAASSDDTNCQQAALEAIAVAYGMPRWRQYVQLNVDQWVTHGGYRTRYDGVLTEEALFATVEDLGRAAQGVYEQCGGSPNVRTSAAQEQSFHTCW